MKTQADADICHHKKLISQHLLERQRYSKIIGNSSAKQTGTAAIITDNRKTPAHVFSAIDAILNHVFGRGPKTREILTIDLVDHIVPFINDDSLYDGAQK